MDSDVNELQAALGTATELAVRELFNSTNEDFYYCCLITTGEAHCPLLSAWSAEAFKRIAKTNPEAEQIKWSYADSPYCQFGDSYFEPVQNLFFQRPTLKSNEKEYQTRLTVMEDALRALDSKGLFGKGGDRNKIYVNVEVMPPDYTNTERAIRLNPPEAIKVWLQEAAE